MPTAFVQNLVRWVDRQRARKDLELGVYIRSGCIIDVSRNLLVYDALQNKAEHLLFVDDDTLFPDNVYDALARHAKPIVSSLVYRKEPPYQPVVYHQAETEWIYEALSDYPDNELISVDAVGLGCALYSAQVFKKLPMPWFEFNSSPWLGEDLNMCRKARKAGFGVYCDTSVKCQHLGGAIGEAQFLNWQRDHADR
jgi:GT2 family glycosyltransferase